MVRSVRPAILLGIVAAAFSFVLSGCSQNPVLQDPMGSTSEPGSKVSDMVANSVSAPGEKRDSIRSELDGLRTRATTAADAWIAAVSHNAEDPALLRVATYRRDQYAVRMMTLIDELQERTKNTEYYSAQTLKASGQIAALLSSVAATIAGAETTKTVFSGLSVVFQGAGNIVDEQFLQKQTMITLQAEMDANRQEARLRIENRLKMLKADSYGVEALDQDLNLYYHAGSLVNAILSISTNAQRRNYELSRAIDPNVYRVNLERQFFEDLKKELDTQRTAPPAPPAQPPSSLAPCSALIQSARFSGTGPTGPNSRTHVIASGACFINTATPDPSHYQTRTINHPEPGHRDWVNCTAVIARDGISCEIISEHPAEMDLVELRVMGADGKWSNTVAVAR